MTAFLIEVTAGILLLLVMTWRRSAAVRYIVKAEELRMRFSDLRHRLIMFAGSGEMDHEDKRAVDFLYRATTLALRYPALYPEISASTCAAFMALEPVSPPKLRKRDLSKTTRGFMQEFLSGADELVQTFSNPILIFLASMGGMRVLELAREVGLARRRRHTIQQWQEEGARVLSGNSMSFPAVT